MAEDKQNRNAARRVAFIYGAVAGLYIIFSDQLVAVFSVSLADELWLQTVKGLLFVLVTACVLHGWLKRELDRKSKLHELVSEKEAREKAILEAAQEGIWSVDPEGVTTYANEALAAMLGYERDELVGRTAFDFIAEEDRETARTSVFQHDSSGAAPNAELRLIRRSGEVMWAISSLNPDYDSEGRITGVTGFLVDITERKEHEQKLARSLREKEVLIQEIHHRVKNNLQVISSFLNLQINHLPDGQDAQHLRSSQNRVRSMALVHERLYQNAAFHEIEMSGYLSDLVHAVRGSVDTSGGRIAVHVDCEEITLDIARAVPVGLIVNELVSNSFEHAFTADQAGTIGVQMKNRENGGMLLEIGDDGAGVESTSQVTESDSLGIQIVHALVEQLHARLSWRADHGLTAVIEIAPSEQSS